MQRELFDDEPRGKYFPKYPIEKLPRFRSYLEPTPQLLESIRKHYVLQPILMIGNRIVEGRRRITATKMLERKTIPVLKYPKGTDRAAVVAIVTNVQRSRNPASELNQLEVLLKQGTSLDNIKIETGLNEVQITRLLRIKDGLHTALRAAFENKIISVKVAETCAKKPMKVQERLLDVLEEDGKLTLKDVSAATKVNRQEVVAKLPADLFSTVSWQSRVKELLQEAQELAKKQGSDLSSKIGAVLEGM